MIGFFLSVCSALALEPDVGILLRTQQDGAPVRVPATLLWEDQAHFCGGPGQRDCKDSPAMVPAGAMAWACVLDDTPSCLWLAAVHESEILVMDVDHLYAEPTTTRVTVDDPSWATAEVYVRQPALPFRQVDPQEMDLLPGVSYEFVLRLPGQTHDAWADIGLEPSEFWSDRTIRRWAARLQRKALRYHRPDQAQRIEEALAYLDTSEKRQTYTPFEVYTECRKGRVDYTGQSTLVLVTQQPERVVVGQGYLPMAQDGSYPYMRGLCPI